MKRTLPVRCCHVIDSLDNMMPHDMRIMRKFRAGLNKGGETLGSAKFERAPSGRYYSAACAENTRRRPEVWDLERRVLRSRASIGMALLRYSGSLGTPCFRALQQALTGSQHLALYRKRGLLATLDLLGY